MRLKVTTSLIVFIMLFLASKIQATVYYIDSSIGSDTFVGSEIQPWKTIQKATSTLLAGDTVYIKAGTYTPSQKIEFQNSGTIGSYISYLAFPGDEHLVVIDGVNVSLPDWYGVFAIISKHYIKISGLKVVNSSYSGFYVDLSTNILIDNNHTYQTQSSGISVWDSDLVTIDNNEVSRACWPTGGKQECISIVTSNRVLVKNNLVYDGGSIGFGGGGEGIDIKDGCTNTIVYNNIIHDIASVGIYVDAYETNQANIHVYENIVYNIFGVGITTASEEGGALENVIVSNNVVHDCQGRGLVVHWTNKPNYLIKDIYIQHNTFYNNGEGLDIGIHPLGENINIVNNIFSQNAVYQMQYSSTDLDVNELHVRNNLIDGINPSWALFGVNYLIANPDFIAASASNFQLQSTSSAINQGVFLAQTVSAGSGTILALNDVGFFTNNYGIATGDLINIEGQSGQFEIVNVDAVNNTITLNNTASWSTGTGISLLYNQATPDIGAYEYDSSLSVPSNLIDKAISYPNPTKDTLYISDKYQNNEYQIISTDGSVVQKGKLNTLTINIKAIASGIYILKIIKSNQIVSTKIIKE
jgi:hypothetical protein